MKRVLEGYAKAEKVLFTVQRAILLVMVAVIVVVNIAQVAGRYVFHFSLPWSEQLSVALFICLIMLGGNLAIKSDDEIKIDLIRFKKPVPQRVLLIIRDVLSLTCLIAFFISSIMLTAHGFRYPQVISSLRLKYAWLFLVMAVGFALMIVDKVMKLLSRFVTDPTAPPEQLNEAEEMIEEIRKEEEADQA